MERESKKKKVTRVGEAECRAIRKLVRESGKSPPVRVVVELLDEIDALRRERRAVFRKLAVLLGSERRPS